MSFADFTMLPVDDPQTSAADDVAAATAGALALPDSVPVAPDDPPVPFGKSWRFNWEAGQFVRVGEAPAETTGFGALEEWCQMALHSARFAHPVFSDDFGMEEPESLIGEFARGESLADWERHLIEALLVHDRVSAVQNVTLRWDSTQGVLYVDSLDVVTDEDDVLRVGGIALQVGGA